MWRYADLYNSLLCVSRGQFLRKILIFGNSGSGKSTLAKELCNSYGLAHLDLDTLAWEPTSPPKRKRLIESEQEIDSFINSNGGWVIEGCYSDLLEMAVPVSNEIIFMNLPVETCIANAKSRPWEPHKYESKEAQDANLGMLIDWIAQYPGRVDTFSEVAHNELYEKYSNKKSMINCNKRNT
jgi:adenylate kinase family enzyme